MSRKPINVGSCPNAQCTAYRPNPTTIPELISGGQVTVTEECQNQGGDAEDRQVVLSEAVVQKLAGHSSIQTTLKHYTAILPEVAREAPSRLPWAETFTIVSNSYQKSSPVRKAKTA